MDKKKLQPIRRSDLYWSMLMIISTIFLTTSLTDKKLCFLGGIALFILAMYIGLSERFHEEVDYE